MPNSILFSSITVVHNKYLKKNNKTSYSVFRHVEYIATRPGVDIKKEEDIAKDEMSLLNEQLSAVPSAAESPAQDINANIRYIAQRPGVAAEKGVHGLFGNFDTSDLSKTAYHVSNLVEDGRTIFQGVLSLREDDAVETGYDQKQNWIDYLNKMLPQLGSRLGIPASNLRWCAAFHPKKGHPHCHYILWSDVDEVRDPFIPTAKQNEYRKMFSDEIFREERQREMINKTLFRDILKDTGGAITSELFQELVKNPIWLPGNFSSQELQDLSRQLAQMYLAMPSHGRFAYKLMPEEVKTSLDNISKQILNLPAMRDNYQSYLNAAATVAATSSPTIDSREISRQKAIFDLQKRIMNKILDVCREMKQADIRIPEISEEDCSFLHEDAASLFREDEDLLSGYDPACDIVPELFYDNGCEPLCAASNVSNTTESDVLGALSPAADASGCASFESFPGMVPGCQDKEPAFHVTWSNKYKEAMKIIYDSNIKDKTEAITKLNFEAESNNTLAVDALGKLYSNKNSIYYNPTEAEKILQLSATHDNPNAYRELIRLHSAQESPLFDERLALQEGLLLMKLQPDWGAYELGCLYLNKKLTCYNFEAGLSYIKTAANLNYSYAQAKLGSLYLWGANGKLKADPEQGREWLYKAIKQGNTYAQETLVVYDKYRSDGFMSLSYRLLMDCAYLMASKRKELQDNYQYLMFRTRSREALKDAQSKDENYR